MQDKIHQTLRQMANMMQIYIISQFGCGMSNRFPREMPAKEKNRQLRYIRIVYLLNMWNKSFFSYF